MKIQSTLKFPSLRFIEGPVETEETKSYGTLYLKKYSLMTPKGPRMIAFTSKNSSFNPVLGVLVYNLKLQPVAMFEIKEDAKEDEVLKMVVNIALKAKYDKMKALIRENTSDLGEFQLCEFQLSDEMKEVMIISGVMPAIIALFGLIDISWRLITRFRKWYEEVKSAKDEITVNNKLFGNQQKNESAYDLYHSMNVYIDQVVTKMVYGLILYGPPGMSKTYMVRRHLHFNNLLPKKDYQIVKGSTLGLISTYDLLYANRKRLLILDDFDTPLRNEDIVNLIKACTDSYTKRIVSLPREKRILNIAGVMPESKSPEKFTYDGQVIVVTNLARKDLDVALVSRLPAIEVNFDQKQIIEYVEKMLKYLSPSVPMEQKREVFDYIMKMYKNDKRMILNFRNFQHAFDARWSNPMYWKTQAHVIFDYKGGKIMESYLFGLN